MRFRFFEFSPIGENSKSENYFNTERRMCFSNREAFLKSGSTPPPNGGVEGLVLEHFLFVSILNREARILCIITANHSICIWKFKNIVMLIDTLYEIEQ